MRRPPARQPVVEQFASDHLLSDNLVHPFPHTVDGRYWRQLGVSLGATSTVLPCRSVAHDRPRQDVRVESVKQQAVTQMRPWDAHERVAVSRGL
jgi:hypothetical protein